MSLRENLNKYFDIVDLKTVCQDLGVDFDELTGGKSEKILDLINLVEKKGRLSELLSYLAGERPDLTWPDRSHPLTKTDVWGPPDRTPLPYEPEFVFVEAGSFLMGTSAAEDPPAHETPQHELFLPSFMIGRLPITNAQYAVYVQQTKTLPPPKVGWFGPNPPAGKEDHPVVGVSWLDAQNYCAWLSELTGLPIRLPTEAEWEKAARGSDGRRYPWGNEWDPTVCNPNSENLTAADAFPGGASPYGCLDMVGNAAEWTSTLWGKEWLTNDFPYPYQGVDGRETPQEPNAPPSYRIFRATTLGKEEDFLRLRCSARNRYAANNRNKRRGFRVAMNQ